MVRLNVLLKSQNRMRFLILAGITAVILQTHGINAQDEGRSEKSGNSDRPRKSANRERIGDEHRVNLSGRSDKPFSQAGKRKGGSNRDGRAESSLFFLEGDFESSPTDEGFVFVNGEFLSRPYTFESSGKQTFVNGVLISEELVSVTSVLRFDDSGEDDDGNRGWEARRTLKRSQQTYAEFLSQVFSQFRVFVVAFNGRSPVVLPAAPTGNDLLSVLVSDTHRSSKLLSEVLAAAGSSEAALQWSDWITGFQPGEDFLAVAKPIVDAIDAAYEEGLTRRAAVQRLENYAYPLTIAGMVISVFSIGHLLSNPPNGGRTPDEVEMSPEVMKIVTRSLILVVVLSLLDLIWTLMASQAGTMRELNPVGGRLIDNPATLIFFKVAMTGLAAGLIFKLRYYRRAQLASWWACLILTLLTVRWLTFNSMLA
ncbi:MAG: hypothetical protein ISQ06_15410 [Planctomycetaceae bacterium]|nr:hypothetical protein [Planctomycetaceae bacterium]